MDIKKSFGNASISRADKEDVLQHIEKMEKNAKNAQDGLRIQIENLAQSRDELSGEVLDFSGRVEELENQLSNEKEKVQQLAGLRDSLYTELEKKQQELDSAVQQRMDDVAACEKEIAAYLEHKHQLQMQVDAMKTKSQQYDAMQNSLKKIYRQAQSDAYNMVEEAKEQSMDAVDIVDDISKEVTVFKTDIKRIREDIAIGSCTAQDRLDSLYYALDSYVQKLHNIKIKFYQANQIPVDAESYDYIDIVNQQKQTDSAFAGEVAEAAEEQPATMQEEVPVLQKAVQHKSSFTVTPVPNSSTLGEAADEKTDEKYI